MDPFEKLWREVEEGGGKPNIFDFFGLPDSADPSDQDVTANLLEHYKNYEKPYKHLLSNFIPFIKKQAKEKETSPKNIMVLIVGASGDGKTTFIRSFEKSFHQMLKKGKIGEADYLIPRAGMSLSAKHLSVKELLTQIERNEKRFGFYEEKTKKILMFEDLQELLCPARLPKTEKLRKEFFDRLNRYKNCFVIVTSTPYNWLELKKLDSGVQYLFDEVIFLEGLDEKYLREIANERIFTFKDNEKVFPIPLREKVVAESGKNPRLMLEFFFHVFKMAFKDKSKLVTETHLELARKNFGIELIAKLKSLTPAKQELLKELASIEEMSATDLSEKTGLGRSTISQYVNELERAGFAQKRDSKNKVNYRLAGPIRNYLEKEMMRKTLEK